jgi:hypothetical protein
MMMLDWKTEGEHVWTGVDIGLIFSCIRMALDYTLWLNRNETAEESRGNLGQLWRLANLSKRL